MIYCIGLRARYDAKLASGRPFYKYGRGIHDHSFHEGGAVWRSEADARAFIVESRLDESRGVYGVLADWDTDTVQLAGEPYRRLLKTSQIVPLEAAEGQAFPGRPEAPPGPTP